MRNTRGLPFDAPYACTGMHNLSISSYSYLILPNITNQSVINQEVSSSWAYLP